MKRWSGWTAAAGLLAVLGSVTACGGRAPGASPAAAPATQGAPPAGADTSAAGARYTATDVRFMQDMIGHHAQALVMTSLVPERTTRPEIRMMAERITVSQEDEIALMRQWLTQRGEAVPDAGAHHGRHATGAAPADMPGMLMPSELDRLAAARGPEFDRLFLEFMIRHHEGALVMVERLLGTSGAGQEVEVFRLASDVDADQRAEIARMRALLRTLPDAARAP